MTQMPTPSHPDAPELMADDPSRQHATLTFLRGAVIALSIALLAGLLGFIYYLPGVAPVMQKLGIEFAALRPIHTTFVTSFVFLAGVGVVHRYFEDIAPPMGAGERLRTRAQVILWAIAGAGILVSLIGGVFSGREYIGFHPIWSVPILLGWMLFAWNFFSHLGKGLWHRPVHVTMWAVGVLFFTYTFIEQHAWLLDRVFADPLVDLRVQWKATGTLVGSFNLFVYGSMYYLGVKLSNDESYAHSRLAYALFGVGLLNSFTNFGHHTYHLPQNHLVKWISFVISMTEIIILTRVVWDLSAMLKSRCPGPACPVKWFLSAAKWWTGYILATSIVISIPPLNALIHGTTVVMGHAMGAMIGIDAMVLFAAMTWMTIEIYQRHGYEPTVLESAKFRRWIVGLNIGVVLLVGSLTIYGLITAGYRYMGLAEPSWAIGSKYFIFAGSGVIAASFFGKLLDVWGKLLFLSKASPAK